MNIAIWWILLLCAVFNFSSSLVPIFIGGFFPQRNEQWDGSSILPAVQLAIEEVNKNSSVLPGYELKMIWNDTKVGSFVPVFVQH